jgi:hypothetical protein
MKIEPGKNKQVDKQVDNREARVNRNENSVFNSLNQLKPAESLPAPPPGAFARILDEARKQAGKEKADLSTGNNDSSDQPAKTSKSDNEKEVNRNAENKRVEEEENKQESGGGDESRNDDENSFPAAAFAGLHPGAKISAENSAPAARAILHIADLERIVSAIRTQNFKDAQQVIIALKNSVLEGLQIRITLTENGKLKAEFLALNEQIKKQLNLRKPELSTIFNNRSVRFSEIDVLEHQEWEAGKKNDKENSMAADSSDGF